MGPLPLVDPTSLRLVATLNNNVVATLRVGGRQTLLTNFVYKTLSPIGPITPPTRFPNVSLWTVGALALANIVADGSANFGGTPFSAESRELLWWMTPGPHTLP
jgi:hypothetical protein